MSNFDIKFTLSYSGAESEQHEIDFYDVSQALIGFQRTIALTTHLVLNDEIITQSPSLKGAQIFALPAEEGSWKMTAGVVLAGAAYIGNTQNNTPLGHLVYSVYDYIVSESLGFHVDYNKSLGQLYEEHKKNDINLPVVRPAQLDSLMEKCTTAITEIHRPIYKNKTANEATITKSINGHEIPIGPKFSFETFQYLVEEFTEDEVDTISGYISSYNSNTFKGRIYVPEEERPVSFELSKFCRDENTIKLVVNSLSDNALRNYGANESGLIFCRVQKTKSKSGHLKKYTILSVSVVPFPPTQ